MRKARFKGRHAFACRPGNNGLPGAADTTGQFLLHRLVMVKSRLLLWILISAFITVSLTASFGDKNRPYSKDKSSTTC